MEFTLGAGWCVIHHLAEEVQPVGSVENEETHGAQDVHDHNSFTFPA